MFRTQITLYTPADYSVNKGRVEDEEEERKGRVENEDEGRKGRVSNNEENSKKVVIQRQVCIL